MTFGSSRPVLHGHEIVAVNHGRGGLPVLRTRVCVHAWTRTPAQDAPFEAVLEAIHPARAWSV